MALLGSQGYIDMVVLNLDRGIGFRNDGVHAAERTREVHIGVGSWRDSHETAVR